MLRLCSVEEFDREYARRPIILIGAGNNAQIILNDYDWNVRGAVDNNEDRLGTVIKGEGKDIEIFSWEDIRGDEFSDCDLMVTPLMASSLIDQVNNDPVLADRTVFVYAYMNAIQWDLERIAMSKVDFEITTGEKPKIPKIIHYFWFSGDPYPEKVQRCIDSWKRFCPDYELRKWDLNNYHTDNTFCVEALSVNSWAAASDFGRCDVLRKYGGIYLDTDVELIRPIDDLLFDEGFFCFESAAGVDPGSGMGSVKENEIFEEICANYEGVHFLNGDGSINRVNIIKHYTDVLIAHGLKPNGLYQNVEGIAVYPPLVMSPYSYNTGITSIYEKTYGIHHWVSAWISEEYRRELDRKQHYISGRITSLIDR